MNKLEKLLLRELYRKSFYDFVKDFWSSADPSKFVDGKLVQFYCEVFQYMCKDWVGYEEVDIKVPPMSEDLDVIDVRSSKRNVCINVPPRHSKSMIFNVLGPVWLWLSYPIKAVSISHTSGLAASMNMKRQSLINSEKFRELFDDIRLTSNSNTFVKDNRGGELYSQNRNSFTGYGGDIIINDDLTNAESARKDKEEMASAWSYYQNTMPSRINDINKCLILNIQQRLAPNDITGHIMNERKLCDQYSFIVLKAQFNKKTCLVCPISGDLIYYEKGSYLWPERFGDYEALRAQVGEVIFETQYLQNPIATDKSIVKPEFIIEKDLTEVPDIDDADMIYASHDFPVKDKDTSDFLGSVLAYRVNQTLYIKDCLEKRMEFVKSVNYVTQLSDFYPGIIQVIEDKANGSPILQQLQDEVPGLQAFQPGTQSKTQRLESATLYMNSGNVVFVRDKFNNLTNRYELKESLENLKRRLLSFPFVEHDDIIDGFSMMVLFVFMDKRYSVYGRAFNEDNIIEKDKTHFDYSTIFFNKEGDNWKVLDIGVQYGTETKLIVNQEYSFRASVSDGINKLIELTNKTVFIDCSASEGMRGMFDRAGIERYEIDDFDKSVAQLNLAFSKKRVLIDKGCKSLKANIENFKFNKSKDENVKYATEKDGYIACLRVALHYYGGIV